MCRVVLVLFHKRITIWMVVDFWMALTFFEVLNGYCQLLEDFGRLLLMLSNRKDDMNLKICMGVVFCCSKVPTLL